MNTQKLLIIGLVWPEPTSSAAGWRMLQLIELFKELNYEIYFASAAQPSLRTFNLESIGVITYSIKLNDVSFDEFINQLSPDMVLFDRFITEEQFGWRVAEQLPNAIRILDGEDFHGLRKAREMAHKERQKLNTEYLQNHVTKRELVSMYRCDLTLVISEAEKNIFRQQLGFPESQLLYLPFVFKLEEIKELKEFPSFEQRAHFIMVGNYLHAPNADAIQFLKNDIWPIIRRALPKAELHVYGAYQSHKAQQLHNEKQGFYVMGPAEDIGLTMSNYKVCLAPLRFGAGLKGKLFDAMKTGSPTVMTSIASEGVFGEMPTNGYIADDYEEFAKKAIELYSELEKWKQFQQNGIQVLKRRFLKLTFLETLENILKTISNDLNRHRQKHFTGQLFLQQSIQATKFMSRWIELKEQREK